MAPPDQLPILPAEPPGLMVEMTKLRQEVAAMRDELAVLRGQFLGILGTEDGVLAPGNLRDRTRPQPRVLPPADESGPAAVPDMAIAERLVPDTLTPAAVDAYWEPARRAFPAIPHPRVEARLLPVMLVLGIALAAVGQWMLEAAATPVGLPGSLIRKLEPVWPAPVPAINAIALFLLAMPLFGIAANRLAAAPVVRSLATPDPLAIRVERLTLGLLMLGAAVVGAVDLRLFQHRYAPSDPRWFTLGLGFIMAGLAWSERARLGSWLRTWRACWRSCLPEAAAVLLLLGVFVYLGTFDLANWRYSAIGDEGAFFEYARRFVQNGGSQNLFSQKGVYDIQPVLFSYFVGRLMQIFGTDGVGWKTATMIPVLLALFLGYFLARALWGRTTALTALGLIVTAHYLLAFEHTGYNNLDPLFPMAAALLFLVLGLRLASPLLLVTAGMFAGLGWYTYYSSRIAVAVLGLIVLLSVPRRRWLSAGALIGVGFALLVMPLFAVNRTQVITAMIDQSGVGNRAEAGPNNHLLLYWNTGRSLLAFNYNPVRQHYVSGSLAEPVTAALFVLGLGYCLMTLTDVRSRLLLVWFGSGVTTTGIFSRYDHVATTRLNFVLPAVVLMAALAIDRALAAGRSRVSAGFARVTFPGVAASVLAIASFGNLHRWFDVSPRKVPTSPTTVTVRVMLDRRCKDAPMVPLVIDRTGDGSLPAAVSEYNDMNMPDYRLFTDPMDWLQTVDRRCLIVRSANLPESSAITDAIAARWPGLTPVPETDGSGEVHMLAFFPPDSSEPTR